MLVIVGNSFSVTGLLLSTIAAEEGKTILGYMGTAMCIMGVCINTINLILCIKGIRI